MVVVILLDPMRPLKVVHYVTTQATTSPVYNIEHKKALKAIHHFARFSSNHEDLLQGK